MVTTTRKNFENHEEFLGTIVPKTGIAEGNLLDFLGSGISIALSIVGAVFFGLTLYASIKWLISRGDEGKIETARKTLIGSIIGLIIIVGAYAITALITERLLVPANDSSSIISNGGTGIGPDQNISVGCCIHKWKNPDTTDSFQQSGAYWVIAGFNMTELECGLSAAGEEQKYFPNYTTSQCQAAFNSL